MNLKFTGFDIVVGCDVVRIEETDIAGQANNIEIRIVRANLGQASCGFENLA